PLGAQLIAGPHFVQQQQQQQSHHQQSQAAVVAQQQQQQQQQKRSAIADPKTGIPMAAYPVTAFSYPSPSPLPIQFQQPYLTAVPMAYIPSPEIVAAQGALVSVGSSYVTYIDKKGQVRCL
ncbi:unnamed protein product, partial [Adineta ricciae]